MRNVRNMRDQSGLTARDVIAENVSVRIVPAVLTAKRDGSIFKETRDARAPGSFGGPYAGCSDLNASIDRIGGQHIHAGEEERPMSDGK